MFREALEVGLAHAHDVHAVRIFREGVTRAKHGLDVLPVLHLDHIGVFHDDELEGGEEIRRRDARFLKSSHQTCADRFEDERHVRRTQRKGRERRLKIRRGLKFATLGTDDGTSLGPIGNIKFGHTAAGLRRCVRLSSPARPMRRSTVYVAREKNRLGLEMFEGDSAEFDARSSNLEPPVGRLPRGDATSMSDPKKST